MRTITRRLGAAAAAACALALVPLTATASRSAAPAGTVASAASALSVGLPYSNSTWGGYLSVAPKGKTVNSVSASWTVPAVSLEGHVGPKPYVATMWVGMDGYNARIGPEQVGLWIDTATPNGQPEYWLFHEMAPANPIPFTTDGQPLAKDEHNLLRVRPGQRLSATVQYADQPGFKWDHQFEFDVYVPGPQGYDLVYSAFSGPVQPPAPLRQQAEVITEIQSVRGHPLGALNLGRVGYDYAQYDLAGPPGTMPLVAVNQHAIFAFYKYPGTSQWYRIFPGAAVASSPPRIENGHALKDHFTTRVSTWGS
jgi:Peptidase A4 family